MIRLLVVDDDTAHRASVAEGLRRLGFEVLEAALGSDAVSLTLTHLPAAVVLGLELPDLDGVHVCERVKAHPLTGDLPVIVVAERGDQRSRVDCFEAGADSFVVKPVSVRELYLRLRVLLTPRFRGDGGGPLSPRGGTLG